MSFGGSGCGEGKPGPNVHFGDHAAGTGVFRVRCSGSTASCCATRRGPGCDTESRGIAPVDHGAPERDRSPRCGCAPRPGATGRHAHDHIGEDGQCRRGRAAGRPVDGGRNGTLRPLALGERRRAARAGGCRRRPHDRRRRISSRLFGDGDAVARRFPECAPAAECARTAGRAQALPARRDTGRDVPSASPGAGAACAHAGDAAAPVRRRPRRPLAARAGRAAGLRRGLGTGP